MHKNKNFFIVFFLLVFSVGAFLSVSGANAAEGLQYTLLEKIPGTDGLGSDLKGYIEAIYKVALVIVTLSAVLMVSIGGFMYLTSAGNTSAMGTAKSVIFDALIGLAIALTAWLLLNVINPDLVNVTLNGLSTVAVPAPEPTAAAPAAPVVTPSLSIQNAAQSILTTSNISLASSGSCSSAGGAVTPAGNIRDVAEGRAMDRCYKGCDTSSGACTENAVNPSAAMLNATLAAGQNYGFTITSIAGGSHSSTSNHYSGKGMDLVPSGSDWQAVLGAFKSAGAASSSFCEDPDGRSVACNGGGADHIHLNFP